MTLWYVGIKITRKGQTKTLKEKIIYFVTRENGNDKQKKLLFQGICLTENQLLKWIMRFKMDYF